MINLNTHSYDSNLVFDPHNVIGKNGTINIQFDNPKLFLTTIQEIKNDINKYKSIIPKYSHTIKTLNLLSTDRTGNWDSINKINAEHILVIVWHKIKTENYNLSARCVFYEQLADISSFGSCSQGRTTRLLQFL